MPLSEEVGGDSYMLFVGEIEENRMVTHQNEGTKTITVTKDWLYIWPNTFEMS